ncbi:MAG: SDR family NAD(P)-dependent oxidoreductase [Proteobacteria bacterium]|nr:SDR family NAD(P)-dependent oxidoreductase [Pseudomonadota bacterium]
MWVVLGASSAIARAFARAAAAGGADIVLAGRDHADLEIGAADLRARYGRGATVLEFDAANLSVHVLFLKRVRTAAAGRTINLFVAFGVMPPQAEIDGRPELVRTVIDTNFAGAANLLQEAAPIFEAQGKGRIVIIGSVAGDRGRRKNYVYGSAKALVAAPEAVARAALNAALKGREEIYTPLFWWGIMAIIRNIPERIFKRLNI